MIDKLTRFLSRIAGATIRACRTSSSVLQEATAGTSSPTGGGVSPARRYPGDGPSPSYEPFGGPTVHPNSGPGPYALVTETTSARPPMLDGWQKIRSGGFIRFK